MLQHFFTLTMFKQIRAWTVRSRSWGLLRLLALWFRFEARSTPFNYFILQWINAFILAFLSATEFVALRHRFVFKPAAVNVKEVEFFDDGSYLFLIGHIAPAEGRLIGHIIPAATADNIGEFSDHCCFALFSYLGKWVAIVSKYR